MIIPCCCRAVRRVSGIGEYKSVTSRFGSGHDLSALVIRVWGREHDGLLRLRSEGAQLTRVPATRLRGHTIRTGNLFLGNLNVDTRSSCGHYKHAKLLQREKKHVRSKINVVDTSGASCDHAVLHIGQLSSFRSEILERED